MLAAQDRNLVLRISWVFGPDRPSFIDAMIKGAQESERVDAIADKFSTPTYTLRYRGGLAAFLFEPATPAPTASMVRDRAFR